MFNISKYLARLPKTKDLKPHIHQDVSKDIALDKCSSSLNDVMLYAKANNIPLPMVFNKAKKKLSSGGMNYRQINSMFI